MKRFQTVRLPLFAAAALLFAVLPFTAAGDSRIGRVRLGIPAELHMIPQYRHDILHDGCRRQVYGIMEKFLKEQIKNR